MRKSNKHHEERYPFRFRNNEDNSGFLLWQVSYMWQQEQRRALLKYHDISQMDYVILSSIYWLMLNEDKITPTILSRHTKIEPVGVAQLLKSLEQRNLINRFCKEDSAKARFIEVTEAGINILKHAIITVETFDDRFFKIVGKKASVLNKFLSDLIKSNG
jgi:DNA-binding MarR family transcriptional regulator